MQYIPAKIIVTKTRDTSWFGMDYNMNIYKGCSPNAKELYQLFSEECEKYKLLYKMKEIITSYKAGYGYKQLSLFNPL